MEQIPHLLIVKGNGNCLLSSRVAAKILDRYTVSWFTKNKLQVASEMAGFTLGEADILRRAPGRRIVMIKRNKKKNLHGALSKGYKRRCRDGI